MELAPKVRASRGKVRRIIIPLSRSIARKEPRAAVDVDSGQTLCKSEVGGERYVPDAPNASIGPTVHRPDLAVNPGTICLNQALAEQFKPPYLGPRARVEAWRRIGACTP